MPGLAFLFKKRWHPLRMDNQKKLFLAEQTLIDQKLNNDEAAIEIAKEKEIQNYEKMADIERDPRTSSLKFMYCPPVKSVNTSDNNKNVQKDPNSKDDELVKSFYNKLHQKDVSEESSNSTDIITSTCEPHPPDNKNDNHLQFTSKENMDILPPAKNQKQKQKESSKKSSGDWTQEQLEERFSFLKNAPTEGVYSKTMVVHHKPFNEVIRHVRCCRCGEWGHKTGERECILRNYNPHDMARQKQEDPLTYMRHDIQLDKQKLILKHGISSTSTVNGNGSNQELLASDDDESDPEEAFLASLTSREKKLLLKRLQEIENNGQATTTTPNSNNKNYSSSSSSSSSSSDSSSSDSDSNNSLPTSNQHHQRKRKSKKVSHSKHKKNIKQR